MARDSDVSVENIDTDTYLATSFAAIKAVIQAISSTTARVMEAEFERIVSDEDVRAHIKQLMPYLFAAGLLSYSGREINEENLEKVLGVLDLPLNERAVVLLFDASIGSHLIYIYAYYFLMAFGKAGTESEILNIVESLGMKPDATRMREVLTFLRSKK